MSHKKHRIEDLDMTILDRITENDVGEWMAARLHSIRGAGVAMESMRIEVWHRRRVSEKYYAVTSDGLAVGKTARSAEIKRVVRELKEKIANNPWERAREKRETARCALKEAEQLEALADPLV